VGKTVRERGFKKSAVATIEQAPLPDPLPARSSRGEGEKDGSPDGSLKMRPNDEKNERGND